MNDANLKKLLGAIAAAAVVFFGYFGYQVTVAPPGEEPGDTTLLPVPTTVLLTGLPDSMTVGDTVGVTGALLDGDGDEIATAPSAWDVQITGGLRFVSYSALTNVVRAAEAGPGAVRYTHLASALTAKVVTQIGAPPDTTPSEPPDTTSPPDTIPEEPPDTVVEGGDPPDGWPHNEPAGMTTLTHITGESLDWSGWNRFGGGWPDSPEGPLRMSTVVDPDSKFGRAVQKVGYAGDVSGWGAPRTGAYLGPGYVFPSHIRREVYVRLVLKLSPNYDYHHSGDKIWLSNNNRIAIGTSFYVHGGTFYVGSHVKGAKNTARQWRPIIPGSPTFSGGAPFGNGPFAKLTRGRYHTIELWKRRSDPGVANGCLRLWIDDVEYTRFAVWGDERFLDTSLCDVEWTNDIGEVVPGISTRLELPMYFGGQGDVKAGREGNDWTRVAEVYVSARN